MNNIVRILWIQFLLGPFLFFYFIPFSDINHFQLYASDVRINKSKSTNDSKIYQDLNEVNLFNIDFSDSVEYNNWLQFKNQHSFKKLYLVFAGPYPSNPSSAFGHLFLLLQPTDSLKKPTPLWDAVNFAAGTDTLSTIEIYLQGFFGGLVGKFKIIPFYEKMREYSFIESRPLWIFPIEISSHQSELFLKLLFILRDKKFEYRFHDKNCASQIESLLYLVLFNSNNPSRVITSPRNVLINSYSLLTKYLSPYYLESIEEVLEQIPEEIFSIVNSIEKYEHHDSLEIDNTFASIVLNILEWKYQKRKILLNQNEKQQLAKLRLAVLNSKNKSTFKENIYQKKFSMHSPSKIGYGLKLTTNNKIEHEFLLRLGMHEFNDITDAYPEYDFISAGKINIGLKNNNIFLNEFWIFNQESIKPNTRLESYTSWKFAVGIEKKYELESHPHEIGVFFGLGKSFSVFSDIFTISVMANINPVYDTEYGYTIKFVPKTLAHVRISNNIKLRTFFATNTNIFDNLNFNFFIKSDLSLHLIRNFPIIVNYVHTKYRNQFGLRLERYFEW